MFPDHQTILGWISAYGYFGIFVLLVLGIVGLPVPDEILLTLAGFLVFKGKLRFAPTLASGVFGSISGISLSYGLGRSLGFYLIKRYGHYIHVELEMVERVRDWFGRAGRWCLVFGYFVPGVRHLTAYVAGTSKLPFAEFALFAYLGGLLWSATFICAGFFLGERWASGAEAIRRHSIAGAVILAALLVVYYHFRKRSPRKS